MGDIQTSLSGSCTENGGAKVPVRHLVVILWISFYFQTQVYHLQLSAVGVETSMGFELFC